MLWHIARDYSRNFVRYAYTKSVNFVAEILYNKNSRNIYKHEKGDNGMKKIW